MSEDGPGDRLRRRRPRAVIASLAAGALAAAGLGGREVPPPGERAAATPTPAFGLRVERPNILVVTVDDLSYRDVAYMPNLRDLMEKGGVTFSDAVAPTPICVPARASLLTGQYAHNHGAVTISGARGGYSAFDDGATVPVALQDAGYDTFFVGKYLNGYGKGGTGSEVPPGWTAWRAFVGASTFSFFHPRMSVDGQVRRTEGYTTHVTTRHADRLITGAAGSGRPWFAWVNYVAPHVGGPAGEGDPRVKYAGTDAAFKTTVPAPKDRDTFAGVPLPRHPNMFPEDTTALPGASPSHRRFDERQKDALRISHQRRLEAARGLDRAVGNLFKRLRATGQLSRTLVVFTSDNGFAVGEHNLNGKLWHYDESLRIPVLMRGPGVPRGISVGTPVTNPDLAATLLDAAGARPPRPLDGDSILPWLKAPRQARVVPLAAWAVTDGERRYYRGVRVGQWTYVAYDKGGEELYDRERDPYELHNLAADPAYAATREALAGLTDRYDDCAAEDCPHAFYPADRALDLETL